MIVSQEFGRIETHGTCGMYSDTLPQKGLDPDKD